MLTPPDFVDDSERQHILNVAPGEGNRPLSVFKDKYSEELAYPGIFLGQQRPENKDRLSNVYYSDICKSELRRSDRRAAMCVENIFYIENLNWEEKCRLIQSDPVTCARHFDFQFNTFLKKFLLNEIAPLGKVKDWFYRVEYQQRGSPHVHMLIWLEDAPVFGVDKDEDVSSFIDKIITCRKPDDDTTLLNLVNRQMHRHSHTCRKRGKSLCRFNYPQPPMRSTRILHPLESVSESDVKILKDLWKDIKKKLNDLKEGVDITFDQHLENLGVSEERYILAIRSSLNSPTVFLKRMPNELS